MTKRAASWLVALAAATATASSAMAANSLADPTRPSTRAAPSTVPVEPVPQGPVLQSTLVAPERKVAVISGTRVKIGDVYEGARVVDIRPYEVLLSRGGHETRLRLMPKLAKEKGARE